MRRLGGNAGPFFMKFPPKQCPVCECPYWKKQADSTGEDPQVWRGEDNEWYHGPEKTTQILVCPMCGFSFSLTLEKGKLPDHTFLVNLLKAFKRYVHPGIVNRFLGHMPPTLIFRDAQVNRRQAYMDLTFRVLLRDTEPIDVELLEEAAEEDETPNSA